MMILEDIRTDFGHIQVTRSTEGITTYSLNGWVYSQAGGNGLSTCAYIHTMQSIIVHSSAERVAMIGGAGCTLATALHRAGCRMTAVDNDPYSFVLAKRYFGMPDGIECVTKDGVQFLEESDATFDAIAIDAFGSDGYIPARFTSPSFFRLVRDRLAGAGIMVMNVVSGHRRDVYADNLCVNIAAGGLPVLIYDGPHSTMPSNTVIAAGMPGVRGRWKVRADVQLSPSTCWRRVQT
jgi:spermidine synthase